MGSRTHYVFGPFRLDAGDRLLLKGDEVVPLTPKALDTLVVLLEHHGHMVSKEELIERVWPDAFVEQNNLAQNVSALRRALGEREGGPRFIETVPKRGYRFVAPMTIEPAGVAAAPPLAIAAGQSVAPAIARPPVVPVPETRYALSGDVNIAYQVVGDGPFDLVFVMGWVSHLEYFWTEPTFARFLRRLASFSRLILFDKRGTGLSDRVTVLPSLEQRMDDVRAVMDAAGSREAALLGVSEGGPLCTLFAATYPEKTRALVMIGSYARRLRTPDYPWGPTAEEREAFYHDIQTHWGGPVGIEARAPSRMHDPAFREWWSTYLRMGASPGAALALTKMNADIDVRHVLPSVRVPTLVIHRVRDRCLVVEEGRYLASRIPGARMAELPGEDHLPFVGDQDALLDAIEDFLTGSRHGASLEPDLVLATVMCAVSREAIHSGDDRAARWLVFAAREIERFRGRVCRRPDGLIASFDGPARAVRCAALVAEAARRIGLGVPVGVHTGECDLSTAALTGPAVDLAASVARHARPGRVVVSSTVRDLVAGSGLSFVARPIAGDGDAEGSPSIFEVDSAHLASAVVNV
jgi:DNA-binding winged helix-turn-helix (wHTH) protein/pimeloyl-ACP methyl ester carboxylesterase